MDGGSISDACDGTFKDERSVAFLVTRDRT